jgi:MerR family copper efflux transcriptional regulator
VAGGDPLVDKLKDFLRISEAAEYLGVSPNTLRNWENAGKIAAHRHPVNGYRLFKQEELDELLRPIQSSDVARPDEDSGKKKQTSNPNKKPR